MHTVNKPTICPQCQSRKIVLGGCLYKKDEDGYETERILEGTWFCESCSDIIGTYNRGYNDVNPESIED